MVIYSRHIHHAGVTITLWRITHSFIPLCKIVHTSWVWGCQTVAAGCQFCGFHGGVADGSALPPLFQGSRGPKRTTIPLNHRRWKHHVLSKRRKQDYATSDTRKRKSAGSSLVWWHIPNFVWLLYLKVQFYSFFNLDARWGGWLTPRPGRFAYPERDPFPIVLGVGGIEYRSRRVRKISPPPGFSVFFFVFSCTLYFIRTCFFVLSCILPFVFTVKHATQISMLRRDSNPQPQKAIRRRPSS
jgi:hypothetical protein